MHFSRRAVMLPLVCLGFGSAQTLHLIPEPREMKIGVKQPLPQGIRIVCATCAADATDGFTQQDLVEALTERQIGTNGTFTVTLTRSSSAGAVASLPADGQAEGYSIAQAGTGVTLTAATGAGLFYAVQTLKQMIEGDGARAVLDVATIRDWPAMQYRGMHDDLSRGPVPTLAFQKNLVRTLAHYKMNLYSPYFEHTQQYASNPLPAPSNGAMTASDARALVAYAALYHVTVVPEQEAFGHLHHNLTWENYSTLAETPHGEVIAPGQPGSLALIKQMFGELAELYPGPFLHIGADETEDLGRGQTKNEVDTRGLGPVYLDFLQQIDTALRPLNKRLLFWGDIAQSIVQGSTAYSSQAGAQSPDKVDPELLNKMSPEFKKNTIAVAWWYSPHPSKGFAKFITPFTTAGFETWVAPGVNDWNVVWPDSNDGLSNIQQFVAEGQKQHSTGMLNTIWNDDGESLADSNWYGLLFGAAASWQAGTSSIPEFQQSYGPVFHGDTTGALNEAQTELMLCHDILRNQAHVGDGSDGLFWIDPWSKDGQPIGVKLRPFAHDVRMHAERALTLIAQARAAYPAAPQEVVAGAVPYDPANVFPSNPTSLRHTHAIDAMELGARKLDFIGLKFQLAEEINDGYGRALTAQFSQDKKVHASVARELQEIRGANGKLEDMRDMYSLIRDLYSQAWLRTNRPYALRPVLEHYDSTIGMWQGRIDRFRSVQRQWGDVKTLPAAADLGLPK